MGLFDLLGLFGSVRILKMWIRGHAQGRAERYLVGEGIEKFWGPSKNVSGKQTFSRKILGKGGSRGKLTGFS